MRFAVLIEQQYPPCLRGLFPDGPNTEIYCGSQAQVACVAQHSGSWHARDQRSDVLQYLWLRGIIDNDFQALGG